MSGQLRCPAAFTLGRYPPVLLVEPIRTYVKVKNSDLFLQSYTERPVGYEDVVHRLTPGLDADKYTANFHGRLV